MPTSDEVWARGNRPVFAADPWIVYIAGPLFSEAERSFNLRIAELCEAEGLHPYLPQRDAPTLTADNGDQVFREELSANERAGLIVANLDGVDVDSGTAFEIGWAMRAGKTIIGVRTDWRTFSDNELVNLMILKAVYLVRDVQQLRTALRAYRGTTSSRLCEQQAMCCPKAAGTGSTICPDCAAELAAGGG